MKRLLLIVPALLLHVSASQLSLTSVKQATYLHGSETDPAIHIIDVPFATSHADPEWRFTAISKPFIPATDGSWNQPHDVNLASLYGIKVEGASVADSQDVNVTIDATKAKVPEGYPFTLAQVIDSVTTCVKLMYPPKPEDDGKLVIKVVK
jgi:hypothetical protein